MSGVMLAMNVTDMLGVSQMLAVFVVNMTAVLASGAATALLGLGLSVNLLGTGAGFRLHAKIHSGFIDAMFRAASGVMLAVVV
jgi:hypothetical protein